jgi:hypothetical protein
MNGADMLDSCGRCEKSKSGSASISPDKSKCRESSPSSEGNISIHLKKWWFFHFEDEWNITEELAFGTRQA